MSIVPTRTARDLPRALPAGREAEYRQLSEALHRCETGTGSVIALHGSVGSGRSELLYAFADVAADRGATVLLGTGSPLEHDFPLGLARQLLQSAPLDPQEAAAAEILLAQGTAEAARRHQPADGLQRRLGQLTLEGLFGLVRGLTERAPVVIAVDDRQDADPQSLEFLLYLVRRTRSAGVLTVLSSRETMTPPNPFFEVELARQPHYRQVRLDVLPPGPTAALFRDRFGPAAAAADDAHRLTGGNPLLLHALMDDHQRAGAPAELAVGEGYRRGLMHCLHRIDPLALRYARGVAVLGPAATPALLADLLLLPAEALPRALYLLHAAGLFQDGGFRHPSAAGDLLAAMRPEDQAALHERAARLLRDAGVEPAAVDTHLRVAEGHRRPPWAVPQPSVPQPSASQPSTGHASDGSARPDPDAGRAVHLASAPPKGSAAPAAPEEPRRTGGSAAVVVGTDAKTVAFRCVPSLPGTEVLGEDGTGRRLKEIRHLFWQGRPEQGLAELERFEAEPGRAGAGENLRTWLRYWYPTLQPAAAPGPDDPAGGMRLLTALLQGTTGPEQAVVRAEAVLRDARPGGRDNEALTTALTVLLYADRADRAVRWCGTLAERAATRCGSTWQALFSALRAEAALRQGDLRTADEAARATFARFAPAAWGVAVGLPLSTMIAARTALGLHQDAARYLDLAVPEAMDRTPAGLHHRYARAGHLLAVGRAEDALAEYRACGDTMARWGLDHLPAIAPWRLGAARAHLALGRPQAAAHLADQQLARLGSSGHRRLRGLALWTRAGAAERTERTVLLERAVDELEQAGAEADLAKVLAELSEAHQRDGDPGRARLVDRRLPRTPALSVVPAPEGLSEAERRVAELAVQGLSNRDIARKLYITVSTVEQHLTRVYRKLGVRRRIDLAAVVRAEQQAAEQPLVMATRGSTGVA
ncbi:AAA family ATPase [Kitasatospora sp. NPDC049285]|uniref:AAA family ATPase n=1 Tax=Kitasatospora sp. NPDC049285 TaxID=3157096 RepID=UPI00344065F7